jgi:hypothetical protein
MLLLILALACVTYISGPHPTTQNVSLSVSFYSRKENSHGGKLEE